MQRDPERAARAVEDRMTELGWSNRELARTAGVAVDTARLFLSAARWPTISTRHKLEAALGWEPGTLDEVARGADVSGLAEVDRSAADSTSLETVTITLAIPRDEWSRRSPTQRQLVITKAVTAALQELEDQDRRDGRAPAAP